MKHFIEVKNHNSEGHLNYGFIIGIICMFMLGYAVNFRDYVFIAFPFIAFVYSLTNVVVKRFKKELDTRLYKENIVGGLEVLLLLYMVLFLQPLHFMIILLLPRTKKNNIHMRFFLTFLLFACISINEQNIVVMLMYVLRNFDNKGKDFFSIERYQYREKGVFWTMIMSFVALLVSIAMYACNDITVINGFFSEVTPFNILFMVIVSFSFNLLVKNVNIDENCRVFKRVYIKDIAILITFVSTIPINTWFAFIPISLFLILTRLYKVEKWVDSLDE